MLRVGNFLSGLEHLASMASNISESSVPTSFYQLNFLAYHWLGGLPRTKDSEALKELINPRTWFPVEDYPDGGGARASTSNKVNFEHSFWKPEGVEVWQCAHRRDLFFFWLDC